MDNTFFKIAIIGLVITNIYVIVRLNELQKQAEEGLTKIQPTLDEVNDIANKIKQITG